MAGKTKDPQEIELGGRKFLVPVERTAGNDFWIMEEAAAAGLTSLHVADGEDAIAFASRVLKQSIESGRIFKLLGALLIPEGRSVTDWTPAMAEETGEFLKQLTAKPDKEVIRGATAGMLQRFFANGLASATTSATSSPLLQQVMQAVQERGAPIAHDLLERLDLKSAH